jgi:hypothetical protein
LSFAARLQTPSALAQVVVEMRSPGREQNPLRFVDIGFLRAKPASKTVSMRRKNALG